MRLSAKVDRDVPVLTAAKRGSYLFYINTGKVISYIIAFELVMIADWALLKA